MGVNHNHVRDNFTLLHSLTLVSKFPFFQLFLLISSIAFLVDIKLLNIRLYSARIYIRMPLGHGFGSCARQISTLH